MSDEKTGDPFETDMLGDPRGQKDELLGAPKFRITLEKQRLVTDLRSAGWSQERIAGVLDCDVKTLRKYFSPQMQGAADRNEAAAIAAITAKMREGNAAAASKVLVMVQGGRAAVPLPSGESEKAEGEAAPVKLGKKEQQIESAANPGEAWGDLLNRQLPN
ncbi:MAG: hypothetical protein KUG81_08160 [Gammaproteobacteria bacterium]|nr:hypothetical protein [Gammaproteobacteria bacterium]